MVNMEPFFARKVYFCSLKSGCNIPFIVFRSYTVSPVSVFVGLAAYCLSAYILFFSFACKSFQRRLGIKEDWVNSGSHVRIDGLKSRFAGGI